MSNDELWNCKVELIKCLNSAKYQEAVDYIVSHVNDLDAQFCEMFINGFDVTLSKILPDVLVDKIESFIDSFLDFRSDIRWQIMKDIRNKSDLEADNDKKQKV